MFSSEKLSGISIISKETVFKGNITSTGQIEIEGSIDGNIISNILTIREDGFVNGNITSKVLNIKGKFTGILKAERVNLSKKSNIKGTIEYVSLCVEDGANVEADLKRVSKIDFNINKDKSLEETKKI